MYYTYILQCYNKDNKTIFYIGYTSNLKERILQHKNKSTKTTKKFTKINLIYYEACLSEKDARIRENQLKTGFGRGYINKRLNNYLKNNMRD